MINNPRFKRKTETEAENKEIFHNHNNFDAIEKALYFIQYRIHITYFLHMEMICSSRERLGCPVSRVL